MTTKPLIGSAEDARKVREAPDGKMILITRIETPPHRASKEILLTFEKGVYRPPRIVDDPEE